MRSLALLFTFMTLYCSVLAKESEPHSFLVIFKPKELKSLKLTLYEIESQFSTSFKTKSYSGNSELALLINVPACEFDECHLGQFLVNTDTGIQHKLQDIAFRLFDMTESKKVLHQYLTSYEQMSPKRKVSKTEKAIPTP